MHLHDRAGTLASNHISVYLLFYYIGYKTFICVAMKRLYRSPAHKSRLRNPPLNILKLSKPCIRYYTDENSHFLLDLSRSREAKVKVTVIFLKDALICIATDSCVI